MSSQHPIEVDIRRLDALRAQTRAWSLGSFIGVLALLAIQIGWIISSVKGLTSPGPRQDEFASALTSDLNTSVVPDVQQIATAAVTQAQPQMQAQFVKLGTRVPEVSSAFMQQLNLLQTDLPSKAQDILQNTYGKSLTAMDPQIRQMFPDVTEQNISDTMSNVETESQTQVTATAQQLFSKHVATLRGINDDIQKIAATEPVDANSDKANVQMAISFISEFNNSLGAGQTSTSGTAKTKKATPVKEAKS